MRFFLLLVFGVPLCVKATAPTFAEHLAFTRQWEGVTRKPYRDRDGHSIGVGHFIPKGKPVPKSWTDAQIRRAYIVDMMGAISNAQTVVRNYDSLPKEARLVLADLVYNVGVGGALKFKKALAACERQDFSTMAAELKDSRWYVQTKRRAKNHVNLISNLARTMRG